MDVVLEIDANRSTGDSGLDSVMRAMINAVEQVDTDMLAKAIAIYESDPPELLVELLVDH